MECIDLEVFGVWSWYVVSNRRLYARSAEEKSRWSQSESPFLASEWFLSSCAKTDGDGGVVSNLRAVVVFALPLCFQLVVWLVSVFVCVCVCRSVFCHSSASSPPPPPTTEPADWESESWAQVRSPPHRRCWRSPSHHGWGQKERQGSLQVSSPS